MLVTWESILREESPWLEDQINPDTQDVINLPEKKTNVHKSDVDDRTRYHSTTGLSSCRVIPGLRNLNDAVLISVCLTDRGSAGPANEVTLFHFSGSWQPYSPGLCLQHSEPGGQVSRVVAGV